jgi:iron(III) transport system substrate-binding protein
MKKREGHLIQLIGSGRRPSAGRRRVAGALVALAATASIGTIVAGGAASAAGTTITLYNGQHVQTTDALVSAFEKKTGIQVAVRSDTEDTLADQIIAEGSRSPADVIFTENSPALEELQTKGLLAPVNQSTLAHTPSAYNSEEGRWVGVSARVSVIVYNTHLLKRSQLPTSVLQLADPKWKGKLALAPGETDFQPIVTAVDRAEGAAATVKWLDGLKANAGSHIYSDNETITSEVNAGQVALGVINQYYWYRLRAELGASQMHSAIAYFAPHNPGYVVDVSGAAVLASSHHKAAAQKFLSFITSKQGQEIIAKGDSFEYPIASGVTTTQPETPFDQLQPDNITLAELGTGARAISLLQQAQLL